MGYSHWSCKESDMSEHEYICKPRIILILNMNFCTYYFKPPSPIVSFLNLLNHHLPLLNSFLNLLLVTEPLFSNQILYRRLKYKINKR